MYQKRKMRQEKKNNNNQEKKLTKVGINWLPCIYTVHQGNLYKIGLFS